MKEETLRKIYVDVSLLVSWVVLCYIIVSII